MNQPIPQSELIINERGAIYHLDLLPEELADIVITVGDPDRVAEVSKYFDEVEVKRQHREFVTHTGLLNGKRISCVGTGIGPDNIDIVMNELDALKNIDLEDRVVKERLTSLVVVRIGTCGSLQADIPVDAMVVGTHGLGIDNLLNYYRLENNDEEMELLQHFIAHTQLDNSFSQPYISSAGTSVLKHFVEDYFHGITVTCPGFYGPQGRVLRLGLQFPKLVDSLSGFHYGQHRIVNFEMETSAIYGLGKLLGHQCLSINTVVANRVSKTFSKDGKSAVDRTIRKVLKILVNM